MTQPTAYAPAERLSREEILTEHIKLRELFHFPCYDALPVPVLILNAHRQIVHANTAMVNLSGKSEMELLGLRPGEALQCIHVDCAAGGCGTTEFCTQCGSVRAILSSLSNKGDVQECRILRQRAQGVEALDLQVTAEPVTIEGMLFAVLTLVDISHAKRRQQLERIFFHDVIDMATGMRNLLGMILGDLAGGNRKKGQLLYAASQGLLDMIQSQQLLLSAEHGLLTPSRLEIDSRELLRSVTGQFEGQAVSSDKSVILSSECRNISFHSDPSILKRVLANLLKNALEASQPEETVTLGCTADKDLISLFVHNPSYIPRDIQLQLFNRSFSTKDEGRGLGTYSAKLLTETYLGGTIAFTSDQDAGTTFTVTLPRE